MENLVELLLKALIRALKGVLALSLLTGCVSRGTLEREVRLSFERGAQSRQGEISAQREEIEKLKKDFDRIEDELVDSIRRDFKGAMEKQNSSMDEWTDF